MTSSNKKNLNINIDSNLNKILKKPSENMGAFSVKNQTHSKAKGLSFNIESPYSTNKESLKLLENQIISKKSDINDCDGVNNNLSNSTNNYSSKYLMVNNNDNHKSHKSNISHQISPNSFVNCNNNNDKPVLNNILNSNKLSSSPNIKAGHSNNTNSNNKSFNNKNNLDNGKNNENGKNSHTIDTPLSITDLINERNYIPLSKDTLSFSIDKYENTRYSNKSLNLIKSFAANTHQGVVRKYNEDRVSIILNIIKPSTYKGNNWPICSFFGVFDGHGGNKCADFLKDSLHNYVSYIIIFLFIILIMY